MPLHIQINPKVGVNNTALYYLSFEVTNIFYKKYKTEPYKSRHEKQFSTGISIPKDRWAGCTTVIGPWISGDDELAVRQNNHLRKGINRIQEIYQRMLDETNAEPHAIDICNQFKIPEKKFHRKTFSEMMTEYMTTEYPTPDEVKNPRSTYLAFKAFLKKSFNIEDQYMDLIDVPLIYRFEIYLKNTRSRLDKPYSPGTIEQYLKYFRMAMDWAFKMGYTKEKVMDKVTFSATKNNNRNEVYAPSIYSAIKWKMAPSDLHKIEITPVIGKHKINLEHYRRLFLIQTWCGMGWADMFKIKDCKHAIVKNLSDKDVVLYYRQKTGVMGMLPLFPELKALLELVNYRIDPGPYSTYRRSIGKMLIHYKVDQDSIDRAKATDDKPHTTARKYAHLGRHLFGSRMLMMGFEMSSVSAMMGHTSIKETEKVYAVPDITKIQANYEQIKAASHLGLKIAI